MSFDYSSYFEKLSRVRTIYLEILGIVFAISIIVLIIYKIKFSKNNYEGYSSKQATAEYFAKEAIAAIVLVCIFVLPQTVALCLDTNKSDLVYEQNVSCTVDNQNSLLNGFDYLMFYDSVKLQNGKSKILCTITGKLPDGKNNVDIVYAKHSRIILEYKVIDDNSGNYDTNKLKE